ncbi:MAG: hypothetical protein Kow0029_04070 [Candidatus Rifleibacteriota bacterium]
MEKSSADFLQLLEKISKEDIPSEFVTYLLETEAIKQDSAINNELLRKLVLNYSVLDKKLHELNIQLQKEKLRIADDLKAASMIQRSLLPKRLPENGVFRFDWQYVPCESMGGDLVNVVPYDEENFLVYLVDVSGHGTRAAMITVVLSQFLQPSSGHHVSMPYLEPAKMMKELEKEFPFSRFGSFFTIIYGVLSLSSFNFKFCNSGHPFPVVVHRDRAAEYLTEHGPMLGLGLPHQWKETKVHLSSESRLFMYTDGITECVNPEGKAMGEDGLLKVIENNKHGNPGVMASQIMEK